MKLSSSKLLKSLTNKNTLDEQIEWIEKKTKTLLRRLPYYKKALTVHNDISNNLYSLKPEQIELASQSYISALKNNEVTSNSSMKSLINYLVELKSLANENKKISEIAFEYANKRMETFIDDAKELIGGDQEELNKLDALLEQMNDSDKYGFTRSKYYLANYEYASANLESFKEEVGLSLPLAKLELYLEHKGKDVKSIYREYKGYDDDFEIKSTRQKASVYEKYKK